MKRKRLLCVVLTLALLFTAQSAAAAAETGNRRSMTITAKCKMPTIQVTVPSTGNVYLNPFKLPVSIGGEDSYEQIISTPNCIANQSDIPLKVDVKVTGAIKAGSDMTLATTSTQGSTSTSKRAFIYFEIQPADTDDPDDVLWDDEYDKTKHIVISTVESGKSKKNVLTLAPKTLDGKMAEEGGYAAFRLTGDAVETPKNAWTAQDGITVEVAFTFTPVPYC